MLKWTRLSLLYVIFYLILSGLGFFLVPAFALKMFFSTGQYDTTFIRITGAFLIVLSAIIIQIFRYKIEILYSTLIAVRIFLLMVWLGLYLIVGDPMFLASLIMVGLGEILSISAFIVDRKTPLKKI